MRFHAAIYAGQVDPGRDWRHLDDDDDDREPILHFHHIEAMPEDAQRMGLDRNTQEGAMLSMAGSLNSGKLSHRIVAWALIAALTIPIMMTIWHVII
jgi:hypothetical protein